MKVRKNKIKKITITIVILAITFLAGTTVHQINQVKSAFAAPIKTESSQVTTDRTKNDKATTTIVTASQVSSSDNADLKRDIGDLKVTPDPRGNGAFIGSGVFTTTYEDGTVEDFDSDNGSYHITHKGPHWKKEIEAAKKGQ